MTRRARVLLVAAVFASWLGATGVNLVYSANTARESEQRWCGVVSTLDDAYRSGQTTTRIGQLLASQIHQLRNEFHC